MRSVTLTRLTLVGTFEQAHAGAALTFSQNRSHRGLASLDDDPILAAPPAPASARDPMEDGRDFIS